MRLYVKIVGGTVKYIDLCCSCEHPATVTQQHSCNKSTVICTTCQGKATAGQKCVHREYEPHYYCSAHNTNSSTNNQYHQ